MFLMNYHDYLEESINEFEKFQIQLQEIQMNVNITYPDFELAAFQIQMISDSLKNEIKKIEETDEYREERDNYYL